MNTLPATGHTLQATKRLLIVATQSEWGGVQGYIFRCAKEARQRGFEVLVTAGGNDALAKRCQAKLIPYRELHAMHRELSPVHDIIAVKELVALIKKWEPTTVYLHSSKAGVVGSIAARIAKAKHIVYRIGGWSFLDPVSPIQAWVRRWSEKATARLKDVIITVHPGDEALARQHHITPREQLVTIANGLDTAAFDAALKPREEARTKLMNLIPDAASSPMLITIANFYPTKDLLGYLETLSIVSKQRPDIRAIIFGDGEQREALETKRRVLNLQHIVSLPGRQDDASTLLRGADLFVLPSAKEGMPWTILEAMAASMPIIATDVGSNTWATDGSAWIVPPKDPQALAHAILEALRDPEQAHIKGIAGRRIVEHRFTSNTMWDKTFNILER